ncbi:hypothetical protein JRD95_01042 [Rickettsia parkeri]|nr:hypothetical protein JRD95_01042 [Rickettsia parkeri]
MTLQMYKMVIYYLIKEGNILIEWLSKKLNNYKLANIARIFDILASM